MAISESLHWYTRKGEPAYEVPYADPGKGMRPTTLRDAKKLSLVPSVSAINGIPAKPGLDRWKQDQLLTAAWVCEVENEKDWRTSVIEIAGEISKQAAEKGTAIHANIERYYLNEPVLDYEVHVMNVVDALNKYYPASDGFVAERSFAHPLGYGGKVDLSYQAEDCIEGIVLDFKSKDFDPAIDPKKLVYPENAMQLDAYRHGLKMPKAKMVNVFVDRETGIVKLYEWPEGDYFEMFRCLLKYWQLSKNYDSSWEVL